MESCCRMSPRTDYEVCQKEETQSERNYDAKLEGAQKASARKAWPLRKDMSSSSLMSRGSDSETGGASAHPAGQHGIGLSCGTASSFPTSEPTESPVNDLHPGANAAAHQLTALQGQLCDVSGMCEAQGCILTELQAKLVLEQSRVSQLEAQLLAEKIRCEDLASQLHVARRDGTKRLLAASKMRELLNVERCARERMERCARDRLERLQTDVERLYAQRLPHPPAALGVIPLIKAPCAPPTPPLQKVMLPRALGQTRTTHVSCASPLKRKHSAFTGTCATLERAPLRELPFAVLDVAPCEGIKLEGGGLSLQKVPRTSDRMSAAEVVEGALVFVGPPQQPSAQAATDSTSSSPKPPSTPQAHGLPLSHGSGLGTVLPQQQQLLNAGVLSMKTMDVISCLDTTATPLQLSALISSLGPRQGLLYAKLQARKYIADRTSSGATKSTSQVDPDPPLLNGRSHTLKAPKPRVALHKQAAASSPRVQCPGYHALAPLVHMDEPQAPRAGVQPFNPFAVSSEASSAAGVQDVMVYMSMEESVELFCHEAL